MMKVCKRCMESKEPTITVSRVDWKQRRSRVSAGQWVAQNAKTVARSMYTTRKDCVPLATRISVGQEGIGQPATTLLGWWLTGRSEHQAANLSRI